MFVFYIYIYIYIPVYVCFRMIMHVYGHQLIQQAEIQLQSSSKKIGEGFEGDIKGGGPRKKGRGCHDPS